tara:strand:+ start:40 stop:696 length:657 start_codon:yes stop_codon:yes gene_type:complete
MPNRTTINMEEARRGIYIDFEGTAVDAPSFLGATWVDGDAQNFVQYVLEEALWPAAQAKEQCRVSKWGGLKEIKELSEREERLIFAWSTHESVDLKKYAPDGEWFSSNVINAIPIAKKWRKEFHPHVVFKKDPKQPMLGKNRLDRYLKLIGYDVPPMHGPGNSAKRIKYVRDMLKRKDGDFSALTPTAKRKWTNALKHNWHDCDGMRKLLITIAQESS